MDKTFTQQLQDRLGRAKQDVAKLHAEQASINKRLTDAQREVGAIEVLLEMDHRGNGTKPQPTQQAVSSTVVPEAIRELGATRVVLYLIAEAKTGITFNDLLNLAQHPSVKRSSLHTILFRQINAGLVTKDGNLYYPTTRMSQLHEVGGLRQGNLL